VRPAGGKPENYEIGDSDSAECDVQLKGANVQLKVDEAAELRMDVIWLVLSRVERREEKERWRRDEARRLAIVAVMVSYSNSVSSPCFSGSQPSQPPNPTHDGGFHCPPVTPSAAHSSRTDTLAQR
jgi:hypothetical protein